MSSSQQQPNDPAPSDGSAPRNVIPVPDHLKVLGDFELFREIGRGGMGTVYEARQRSLKRIVALKVLSSQASASATVVERFLREAQAAAKLHHTHIVPIFAQGEESGVYFYAMELVEGQSLHSIISSARNRQAADTDTVDLDETIASPRSSGSHPAPTDHTSGGQSGLGGENDSTVAFPDPLGTCSSSERCAAIVSHIADVADGLDYAHRHGVIHRDIKPHNLMLGEDGRLRIADFGLARLSEQVGVTMTGEMLGSPLYMAPEQILEGPAEVDARVDLYALGVTFYEWLVLRPPFQGETRERILSTILNSEPESLRSINPDLPLAVETICAKAMSRNKRHRYQTAGAFRDDLRRFLADEPIIARRAGLFGRTRRFFQRHQVGAFAALAGVLAVALGLSLITKDTPANNQTVQTPSAPFTIVDEQTNAQNATAQTSQLLNALRTALPAEFGVLTSGAGLAAPVMQDLMRSGQQLSALRDRSASEVADSFKIGTPMGITQRAAPALYESVVSPGWPPASHDPDDGFAKMLVGANELRKVNPASALQFVDMYVQNRTEDFDARQLRAALAAQMGYYDRFAQDAEILVRLDENRPAAYLWHGLAELLLGKTKEGLADLTRAEELKPGSQWAGVLRGLAFLQLNQAPRAVQTFTQVLESAPDLVLALLGRAAAYAANGSLLDAVADLTHVLRLQPKDADALTMRGDYRAALGRYADASTDFESAIEVAGETPALFFRLMLVRSQRNTQAGQAPALNLPPEALPEPNVDSSGPEASDGTSNRLPIEWLERDWPGESSEKLARQVVRNPRLPRFCARWP